MKPKLGSLLLGLMIVVLGSAWMFAQEFVPLLEQQMDSLVGKQQRN